MRVWTIHPKYLNRKELSACWHDGLRALKVLSEPEKYQRFYEGLSVFRVQSEPVYALAKYLQAIGKEGVKRGLQMDLSLLPEVPKDFRLKIPVSEERIASERKLLTKRLAGLGRWHLRKFQSMLPGRTNPLFFVQNDNHPSPWEIISRVGLSR